MNKKVYFFSAKYQKDDMTIAKSGFFEYDAIKTSKDASKMEALIKEQLDVKSNSFVLVSLNVIS